MLQSIIAFVVALIAGKLLAVPLLLAITFWTFIDGIQLKEQISSKQLFLKLINWGGVLNTILWNSLLWVSYFATIDSSLGVVFKTFVFR